ncbi:DNA cytosine methyltransferase, partial [Enterobacteriaceae bacterium 8376wD7]|nr:DNA cytosine methyltransferase [Enterobacteriaceae bacterium 8376wD7]
QRIDGERPKILDLFCGAGGAGMGYSQAGFDVTGVDIEAHPDNPHDVIVADALEMLTDSDFLQTFDAVHASPPCQGFTTMSNRYRGKGGKTDTHPRLIATVREHLEVAGVPYVIENVLGARKELRAPVLLRGGMFDLGVDRPRLFETSLSVG